MKAETAYNARVIRARRIWTACLVGVVAVATFVACGAKAPSRPDDSLRRETPWLAPWLENPECEMRRIFWSEDAEDSYASVLETGADTTSRVYGRRVASRSAPMSRRAVDETLRVLGAAGAARRIAYIPSMTHWDAVLVLAGERAALFLRHRESPRVRFVRGGEPIVEANLSAEGHARLGAIWSAASGPK